MRGAYVCRTLSPPSSDSSPLVNPLRVLPATHRTHWASQSFPEQKTSVLSQHHIVCVSETGKGPDTWIRDGSRQPYSNFSNRPHPPRQNRGAVLMGIAVWRVTEKPKKIMPNMSPNWSQRGSQHGAKIVKNEVLEAPCFKGGSQVASRPPPGSILERFWDHFGTIFVSVSDICLVIFASIL